MWHYIFILWFLLSFFYLFFFAYAQPSHIVCLPYFTTWCGLSANLRCRSETCCMRLAENTGCKKSPKICHLRTITQLCWAISSQLRHVSTVGEKLVKQQYVLHMSSQYGELRPTSGWNHFVGLGHPSKFQRVSCLGSITAQHSGSGHQPNCGVEQRAPPIFGRAAHWALAHIVVFCPLTYSVISECWPAPDKH